MSTQGDKLKAIADAIREVDGTDEPIVANDFPDRIRSISPGVKSFNGRTGDVVPAEGDYTAEQVGALPLSGGTMTGEITSPPGGLVIRVPNLAEMANTGVAMKATPKIIGDEQFVDISVFPVLTMAGDYTSVLTRIRGVSNPQTDHDAANKAYVDSKAGGLSVASNAGAHNSIFRGKFLGTAVTVAQYAAIEAGTFDDLFIGDYWTINGVNWRIASFDYYLGTGISALTTHHVVIVPDTNLDTQKMNDTNVTTGGYVGSKMYTNYLATARTKVNAAFSGHVLTHEFYLSNAVSNGKVTGSTNVNQDVVLMSERNVYGQTIMSSECANGSDKPGWITYDKTQFQLFALAPEFIQKRRGYYWLRDVISDSYFALVYGTGLANQGDAYVPNGVRPAFSIHG